MRPYLTAAICAILASSPRAGAQDVQYRMTMRTEMPSLSMPMPAQTLSVFSKGDLVRIDATVSMPGTLDVHEMTLLMDYKRRTMTAIMREDKQYDEHTLPAFMNADTAQKMFGNELPQIKETGRVGKHSGYETRQVYTTIALPGTLPLPGIPLKDGNKLVMVTEQWVSKDPRLVAVGAALQRAMSIGASSAASTMFGDKTGFPLEMTNMMIEIPKDSSIDVEAIAKLADKAPGLVMLMSMKIDDLKFTTLDPSWFVIPSDYTKR